MDIAPAATVAAESPAPTVYQIPRHRLSLFTEKFAALQRRAAKLGCPVPTFQTGELAAVKRVERDPIDGEEFVTYFEFYPVTVTGASPRIDGWAFLAVVDYEAAAPMFRKTPLAGDLEIPVRYRAMGPVCEHCTLDRGRKETFLLAHEDGRVVQVGRTCLRDFLGHASPDHLAAVACFEAELHSACGGDDGDWMSGAGPFTPDVGEYLAWVVWSINRWGWLSRSAAGEFGSHTAGRAANAFEAYLKACKEGRGDRAAKPGEAEKARAAAVLAWAQTLGDGEDRTLSDYEHNLRTVCSLGRVGDKHFGLVASAVAAFDRSAAGRKGITNEHVGTVGERLRDVRVFVDRVISLEFDEFGRSIVLLRDLAGHVFKWTTATVPHTGREYTMTATVKAHGERQGVLQTILTRAELVADDEPTKAEERAARDLADLLDTCETTLVYRLGWGGPTREAFRARRLEDLKASNVTELTALRAELTALAAVIEPTDEPADDRARGDVARTRACVRARLAPAGTRKLKPAEKAAAKQHVEAIRTAADALRAWPFRSSPEAEMFVQLAEAITDDLPALAALRADLRTFVAGVTLEDHYATDERALTSAANARASAFAALDADVAVVAGANPAAATRLFKAVNKAATQARVWPLAGWEGSDGFLVRAREAEKLGDVVTLTALRDELVALLPTIPADERAAGSWSEERLAGHRAEALGYLVKPAKKAAPTAIEAAAATA